MFITSPRQQYRDCEMGLGVSVCSNLFINHASCIPSLSCRGIQIKWSLQALSTAGGSETRIFDPHLLDYMKPRGLCDCLGDVLLIYGAFPRRHCHISFDLRLCSFIISDMEHLMWDWKFTAYRKVIRGVKAVMIMGITGIHIFCSDNIGKYIVRGSTLIRIKIGVHWTTTSGWEGGCIQSTQGALLHFHSLECQCLHKACKLQLL